MTDTRELVAQAIADAVKAADNEYGGCFVHVDDLTDVCIDGYLDLTVIAGAVLAALTKAGYAVVELPTPDDESEDDGKAWLPTEKRVTVRVYPDGDLWVTSPRIRIQGIEPARELAEALLAAAAAAETGGKA